MNAQKLHTGGKIRFAPVRTSNESLRDKGDGSI